MSETNRLTDAEAASLLRVARAALTAAVEEDEAWKPDLSKLPDRLRQPGAAFVTLYTDDLLHGCIGSITPRMALALDVAGNAEGAALRDPRFPPLQPHELAQTEIEVSVLSPLQPLKYTDFADLVAKVRPFVDGVLVERGWQRGVLLPQVWEKLPNPREFLVHVAMKAQASLDIYDAPETRVYVFQVEHYEE
ncbi:MAG: AmmeMemoRadiSam system protein A [Caldilineales bacterium]|nr:AmmeMemoRadiSam system protein A [Caldilineales bacterium]